MKTEIENTKITPKSSKFQTTNITNQQLILILTFHPAPNLSEPHRKKGSHLDPKCLKAFSEHTRACCVMSRLNIFLA